MACATSTMASATRTFLITARLSAPAPEAVAGAVTVSGAIACAGTVARGVSASCRLAISAPPSRASGPRTFTRCRLLASVVEPGARSSPHDAAPRRYVPPTGTAAADGNLNASSCVHRQDRKSMPHPPARDDRAKTQKTRMRLVPSATSLLLGAVEAATEPDAGSRSSRAVHCRFEHAGQFFRSPPVPRMEATGDFWKGPFCRLEAEALECVLADAKQVKNLPGRPKRDPSDSRWLAACFVATPEFRISRLPCSGLARARSSWPVPGLDQRPHRPAHHRGEILHAAIERGDPVRTALSLRCTVRWGSAVASSLTLPGTRTGRERGSSPAGGCAVRRRRARSAHDCYRGRGVRERQDDGGCHARRAPALGLRRRGRLPSRGEHREDAVWRPADRRGPLALAAGHRGLDG